MTTEPRPGERDSAPAPGSRSARELSRVALRVALGAAMIFVGVLHFATPQPFLTMMPSALPFPLALVYVSGIAEIAGGAGLFVPRLRKAASFGLIALYIAVFPANLNMAIHDLPLGDTKLPPVALWGRLPLQLVFIAWAFWVGGAPKARIGDKGRRSGA